MPTWKEISPGSSTSSGSFAGIKSNGNVIVTGSVIATVTVSAPTFDGTASYAFTASVAPGYVLTSLFNAFSSSYNTGSFTGSFIGDGSGLTGVSSSFIVTGSIYAQVGVGTSSMFLIQSNSIQYVNIQPSSQTTINSDYLTVKGFTSGQSVLTVSQSIIQMATHSVNPSGSTTAGSIWFTSSSLYIGLE